MSYPIVYVRGFAPTGGARDDNFYDAYYGFADTSVEKRQALPTDDLGRPWFMEPVIFEGQLLRLLKENGYTDAANGGLSLRAPGQDPRRSVWIARFYDQDVIQGQLRSIEEHAEDLRRLICDWIPTHLEQIHGVDLGPERRDYKVILVAHSMGGLVCRCLMQNLWPTPPVDQNGQSVRAVEDPKRWVHRFVTFATPHGGIEAGNLPDFLQSVVIAGLNPLDTAIFRAPRMRQYLNLSDGAPITSLDGHYPLGRCLCLIGSDWADYPVLGGLTAKAIGNFSDGLVRQDRAYITNVNTPNPVLGVDAAYYANVHRSHSGRRGIVNSFESYQNLRRFLFGDTKVSLALEAVNVRMAPPPDGERDFYDFEFSVSVRGTAVYLHRRQQIPCENALRYEADQIPTGIPLHTGFLDTALRPDGDPYSHFLLAFRVAQYRVQKGFLFDHDYPERTIYSETLEVRVGADVQYRWLIETTNPGDSNADPNDHSATWTSLTPDNDGAFRLPMRPAATFEATLVITAGPWPDAGCQD